MVNGTQMLSLCLVSQGPFVKLYYLTMFQMYEFFAGIKFLSSVINAQFRANFKANRNQPKDKSLSYHEGSTLNKT